jgi:uncharacterized repeat protein (TIGR02543 family)
LVLSKLKAATTYQFRITATDVDGRKAIVSSGGFSSVKAQLSKLVTASATTGELTTGSKADKTAPTITKAPEVIDVNGVIEIRWSTNEAADSRVYFGKKSETIRRVAGGIDFATSHKVRLPAVTPASDNSFRIVTVDPAGNAYTSPDYDLTSSPSAFSLTVTKSGNGTVTSNPAGITCGDDCVESYASGAVVTLVATANAEQSFSGWGGACSGTSTCVVTMSAAKNVTAEFSAITPGSFPVTVSKSDGGTVTSVPAGIDCGPVCGFEFKTGTAVSLTATAEPGYQFNGWAGDCTGASTCVLTVNSAKTVTASFVLTGSSTTFPLTTSVSGSGTITSNPAGIACGTDCSEDYPANAPVTLTATPVAGYSFAGWSGDCTGTGSCVVTMSSSRTVKATFSGSQLFNLKVTRSPNGTVVSDLAGIACGMANRSCKASFAENSKVTLSAEPKDGFMIKKWNGCTSSNGNICQITVSKKNMTVSPIFVPLPKYKLTINKTKYGSVISSLGKPKCNPNALKCSASFASGTDVTLTLKPMPGRTYLEWSGACAGVTTDTCTVRMDSPKTVGASFQLP